MTNQTPAPATRIEDAQLDALSGGPAFLKLDGVNGESIDSASPERSVASTSLVLR